MCTTLTILLETELTTFNTFMLEHGHIQGLGRTSLHTRFTVSR